MSMVTWGLFWQVLKKTVWFVAFFLLVTLILPAGYRPSLETLGRLWQDGVLLAAIASTIRWSAGWLIGIVAGVVIGVIGAWPLLPWERAARLGRFYDSHHALLHFLRAVPVLGIPMIALFAFGTAEAGKVFIVGWGAFFPVWLSTYRAARNYELGLTYVAKGFGLTKWDILRKVIMPSISLSIASGARLSVGTGWICVVAAEMLGIVEGSRVFGNGLGKLLWHHMNNGTADVILAVLVIFGLLGLISDLVVAWVFRALASMSYVK